MRMEYLLDEARLKDSFVSMPILKSLCPEKPSELFTEPSVCIHLPPEHSFSH